MREKYEKSQREYGKNKYLRLEVRYKTLQEKISKNKLVGSQKILKRQRWRTLGMEMPHLPTENEVANEFGRSLKGYPKKTHMCIHGKSWQIYCVLCIVCLFEYF